MTAFLIWTTFSLWLVLRRQMLLWAIACAGAIGLLALAFLAQLGGDNEMGIREAEITAFTGVCLVTALTGAISVVLDSLGRCERGDVGPAWLFGGRGEPFAWSKSSPGGGGGPPKAVEG